MKKNILDVNKKWNRLMGMLGTPIIVFIFLSWCTNTLEINNTILICFFFAVSMLIGATNFILAVCETVLGIPFLLMFREWFLVPRKIPFVSVSFNWWGQQTAFAGLAAFAVIMIMLKIVLAIIDKTAEK